MPDQQLALLKVQKRLLDDDLVRRNMAIFVGLISSALFLTPLQIAIGFATYLPADVALTLALGRLIGSPTSRFWFGAVLFSAFWAMSSYLLPAAMLWQVPGPASKVGAVIYTVGGMLSIMLVRTVYRPMTIANSLPLLGMIVFVAVSERNSVPPVELAFLTFAMAVLAGYFALTLNSYLRIHSELSMARDAALARVETQRRFLATMSHELRTPLNGILGVSQALVQSHPDIGAEVIRDSARAMTRMVGDLLDHAAIDAGALRIAPRPCNPVDEVQRLSALWQARFAEKGLELTLTLGAKLPEQIMADPVRLAQCVSNLLANALHHTPSGTVELALSRSPVGLQITVTDSGPGLPAGAEQRLFRPYEQIQTADPARRKGSGLGLSISRGLARAMGGDLVFERPIQGGARFRLTFRAEAPAPSAVRVSTPTTAAPRHDLLANLRVLVVDDIATNRLVLRLLLAQHQSIVAEAQSGQAALQALAEVRPEVILLDLRMPGLSGQETLTRLRDAGFGGPIIAVSADAAPEEQRGAIAFGFDGYLIKPVEESALVAVISKTLERSRHL